MFFFRVFSYIYVGSNLPILHIDQFLSFWHLFYLCPFGFLHLSLVILIIFSSLSSILPWPLCNLIFTSKMILSFSLIIYWVITLISYLPVCSFVWSFRSGFFNYLEVFFQICKYLFKIIQFKVQCQIIIFLFVWLWGLWGEQNQKLKYLDSQSFLLMDCPILVVNFVFCWFFSIHFEMVIFLD